MKVLIVHNTYTQTGGEDSVVKAEAELLRESGIDVVVKYYENPISKLKQVGSLLMEPFNIFQYFRFVKTLKREQPNLVHLHNWHFAASPSIIWAAKASGIPVIMTIHNYRILCPSASLFHDGQLFLDSLRDRNFISAIKHKVYHNSYLITAALSLTLFVNKRIKTWRRVDKLIFLNEFMADLYKKSYLKLSDQQVRVKPNFVIDRHTSEINLAAKRSGFLFVGRLSSEKGIEILLDAFVGSEYPLTIIGDGPLKTNVLEASSRFNNIAYLGFKRKNEILEAMGSCEALIFPSIWYEGMPITILEAFSCGTPVIASNIGSLQSLVEDHKNGLHFTAGEPDDLRSKIAYWASLDIASKDTLHLSTSFIYNKKYTAEKNMDQLINIYKEAVQ